MMTRLLTVVIVLTLVTAVPKASGDPPETLPATDPSRRAPAWIAESAAASPAGLSVDLFQPNELRRIERSLQTARETAAKQQTDPASDCAAWSTVTIDWENPQPNDSVGALTSNSKAIYAARVVGSRQGFLFGHPGTLLEMEVDAALKGPEAVTTPDRILVFYQYARIVVGDTLLCARPESGEQPPEIGDRALVFAYRNVPRPFSAGPSSDSVLVPEDREFLFERRGKFTLPGGLRDIPADLTFDGLQRLVGRMSGTGEPDGR